MPRMAHGWVVGWLTVWAVGLAGPGRADSPRTVHPPADGAAPPVSAPDDPWTPAELAGAPVQDELIRRRASAGSPAAPASASGGGQSWLRTTASLAGVVALIILLAWGYRLVTGGTGRLLLGARARHAGLIELLARANLGPRQTLYLVRVGPQVVLLGATAGSLTALSVIDGPDAAARLAGERARAAADSCTAEFHRCLEGAAREYGAPGGEADAEGGATAVSLTGLWHRLTRRAARPRQSGASG